MFLKVLFLNKTLGEDSDLNNINFSIKKGDFLTLIGPSGGGKSSLLKALGGFVPIDSGEIELDGQAISTIQPEDRNIITLFQSFDLFPNLNVSENVIYGLKAAGYKKADALDAGHEILERVGLVGFDEREPDTLSGGQQQRVALARSLALKPKLLLLDEPFSNVDTKTRRRLLEEIKAIQIDTGITIIYVTHRQEEAFDVSDQIMLLNKGKIEQFGTPRELKDSPANEFVKQFISE